jgi:hypothetical protein
MKTRKYLILFLATSLILGCNKDDAPADNDPEEFFSATVVDAEGSFNFEATKNGITDYMTARTQGSPEDTRLQLRAKNFDDFLDIQFEISGFQGSGTYTSGDREDNPNIMRFGLNRNTTWWNSGGSIHQQVTTGTLTINDSGAFLQGTFSFQAYRQTTYKQVNGSFKVRKDY